MPGLARASGVSPAVGGSEEPGAVLARALLPACRVPARVAGSATARVKEWRPQSREQAPALPKGEVPKQPGGLPRRRCQAVEAGQAAPIGKRRAGRDGPGWPPPHRPAILRSRIFWRRAGLDRDFFDAGCPNLIKHGDNVTEAGLGVSVDKYLGIRARIFEGTEDLGEFDAGQGLLVEKELAIGGDCPATITNGSRRQLKLTPGDNYQPGSIFRGRNR